MKCIRTAGVYHPDAGRTDGEVVVFEDGRVTEVRDSVPSGAEVVYEGNAYALPGLVDAHSHAPIRPWEGEQGEQLKADPAVQAVRAARNLRRDLQAGTTTMRLMGCEHHLDVHLSKAEAAGELDAPRLLACGAHLTPTGGHGVALTTTDGEREIRERIRENLTAGAHHVKYFATGGVSSKSGGLERAPYSDAEAAAIVDEAHRQGVHVAAHAHGGPGARQAIEAGVDTIEHAGVLESESQELLAERDRHVVGTFTILHDENGIEAGDGDDPEIMAKVERARVQERATWEELLGRDVAVALGTDSMHGSLPGEVRHLLDLGGSPERAIRAVTTEAARAARVADVAGSLAAGKHADAVLVADHPVDDPTTLSDPVAVLKGGEVLA